MELTFLKNMCANIVVRALYSVSTYVQITNSHYYGKINLLEVSANAEVSKINLLHFAIFGTLYHTAFSDAKHNISNFTTKGITNIQEFRFKDLLWFET